MKKCLLITFSFIVVVTLFGCRKNKGESVLDFSPDFEEKWYCEGAYTDESPKANVISFSYGSRKSGTYSVYNDNDIDIGGYATIKGNVITIRDDYSITKKAHTFNVDEFPVKLNTIDGKWWRIKIDGIYYYCQKGSTTSINTCGPDGYEVNVWNATNDTIQGVYNNQARSIAPNSGLVGHFRFASDVSYTDNRGNSFTYKAVDCNSNNEVQLH